MTQPTGVRFARISQAGSVTFRLPAEESGWLSRHQAIGGTLAPISKVLWPFSRE